MNWKDFKKQTNIKYKYLPYFRIEKLTDEQKKLNIKKYDDILVLNNTEGWHLGKKIKIPIRISDMLCHGKINVAEILFLYKEIYRR